MLLWSITEDDVVHGLVERGLPIHGLADLTAREIDLIHQYASMVFDTAAREFLEALAARLRRERGWAE
ncbi:MAG: hypothetical protein Q8Q00_00960 [Dehalococcoidia bacterium]|nr:hypothetical protein [Dehalococcoidia bacterium]